MAISRLLENVRGAGITGHIITNTLASTHVRGGPARQRVGRRTAVVMVDDEE
ncbi:hypothetical protein [Natronococcus sp. A-GB7]|uniref:hypothetical protein n=1 Tax=Natronococcus sp. A-GB7 TaxID=3037649 RepID=UPI00241F32C5|nr:hypothetical protein [Natronococcus sp. A-GB7]MDG5821232.1 hypothetical protein [Natronococcus sp. A-GB7]